MKYLVYLATYSTYLKHESGKGKAKKAEWTCKVEKFKVLGICHPTGNASQLVTKEGNLPGLAVEGMVLTPSTLMVFKAPARDWSLVGDIVQISVGPTN
jgi:hypothetical protein